MLRIAKLIQPIHNLITPRLWFGTIVAPTTSETALVNTLKSKFLKAKDIQVTDISEGCGSMYEILIESVEFQGMSRVKQHQMVVDTLKKEINEMHGIRIHTIVVK